MDVPCSAATSAGGRGAAHSACCAVSPPVLHTPSEGPLECTLRTRRLPSGGKVGAGAEARGSSVQRPMTKDKRKDISERLLCLVTCALTAYTRGVLGRVLGSSGRVQDVQSRRTVRSYPKGPMQGVIR